MILNGLDRIMLRISSPLIICSVLAVSACVPSSPQPPKTIKRPSPQPITYTTSTAPDMSIQLGGQVYANDADAIKRLMAMSVRSPEQESYLTMLARKYDFYGKPENLNAALVRARKASE